MAGIALLCGTRMRTVVSDRLEGIEDVEVSVVEGHVLLLYVVEKVWPAGAFESHHLAGAVLHGVFCRDNSFLAGIFER